MKHCTRLQSSLLSAVPVLLLAGCIYRPPGQSFRGELPPATDEQQAQTAQMRKAVEALAGRIGPRSLACEPVALVAAQRWLGSQLGGMGYAVDRQHYAIGIQTCTNLSIEIKGTKLPDEIVLMGAHYDTVPASPGANDNGSGVAALLVLARQLAHTSFDRTIRLVFFTNEENPYAWTERMGSYQYARRCRERNEKIVAMISLDEIGCYSSSRGSQKYIYPLNLLYPSRASFITIVTNADNRHLMNKTALAFRRHVKFPCEGLAMQIRDVGRSDHWSFWQCGYPAVLMTDTANFRYAHYHQPTDTPDRLDYDRLARVVDGLRGILRDLSSTSPTCESAAHKTVSIGAMAGSTHKH